MKVMILGGDGMLGHQLISYLSSNFEVSATYRQAEPCYRNIAISGAATSFYNVQAQDFSAVKSAILTSRPDALINSIGIVKQRASAYDSVASIEVNSLFPHKVNALANEVGIRFVNISTDCVFSGIKGMYKEEDVPDASDLYGRSKLLGETVEGNSITLRTSIIGLELSRKASLIEWFLSQRGPIKGYRRAIYSGFTTLELARIIGNLLLKHPEARGLYHVSSDPIDKFTLLSALRNKLSLDIEIEADDAFASDKSLVSDRFRTQFNYVPPSWDDMLSELASQIEERDR